MLTPEQIQSFRDDGFLTYGKRVLTDEQLTQMREGLDNVLSGKSKAESLSNMGSGGLVVTQVVNVWEAEPAFKEHLYQSEIVPMIAQLMDTDTVRVWHDQAQIKPAFNGGPTIWHQDHPYWPVIQPADLVSAWVALEDATIENGCMWMVPGSYKWGRYKDGTIGQEEDQLSPNYDPAVLPAGAKVEIVPCEVPAGHVVFHHCLTWHGAPPNKSEHPRPAIAVHYMPGYTRYEPSGRAHLVEHHIEVGPGEVLKGTHFPTVMEDGQLLEAA